MESSSTVRVIEMKDAVVVYCGIGASEGRRETAKLPVSCRNLICTGPRDLNPAELSPAWAVVVQFARNAAARWHFEVRHERRGIRLGPENSRFLARSSRAWE